MYLVTVYRGIEVDISSGTCFFLPILFQHRFEFNVSLEQAQTRKLDVAVKNNKMFHTRERKDIGMVGIAACDTPCFCIVFLKFLIEVTFWLPWLSHFATHSE